MSPSAFASISVLLLTMGLWSGSVQLYLQSCPQIPGFSFPDCILQKNSQTSHCWKQTQVWRENGDKLGKLMDKSMLAYISTLKATIINCFCIWCIHMVSYVLFFQFFILDTNEAGFSSFCIRISNNRLL